MAHPQMAHTIFLIFGQTLVPDETKLTSRFRKNRLRRPHGLTSYYFEGPCSVLRVVRTSPVVKEGILFIDPYYGLNCDPWVTRVESSLDHVGYESVSVTHFLLCCCH
jgi:hypothetical protein